MNKFRRAIAFRVILIGFTTITFSYLAFQQGRYVGASLFAFLLFIEIHNLYLYVEGTNRKLTRFLQSIRYSDFDSGFVTDNKLGKSFKELNYSFNEVLDAFRETRAVSEGNLQYLNTVVRHIGIGILSFEQNGKVELLNTAACRLLGINKLHNIGDLAKVNPSLLNIVQEISLGSSVLFRDQAHRQLSIHATELRLRGKAYKLLSIQNIQEELQAKELEAWQNLAVALRHEIVNSITPIASIVSTLNEIMSEELIETSAPQIIHAEVVEDIRLALKTVGKRSQGLIRFVNAYKDFTRIPEPVFSEVKLHEFFREIDQLMQADMEKAQADFICEVQPANMTVIADEELLQMALINLLKNAGEAVSGRKGAKVQLKASEDLSGVRISVEDNGPGIIPQALEKIFVPFYSTKSKKGGTGVGLSICRQIIQQHSGNLTVESIPNERTVFVMRF